MNSLNMTILETTILLITLLANSVMDSIMSDNRWGHLGIWFSNSGWKVKHKFTIWLNQWLPLWFARFLALTVFVNFTELYKLAKGFMIMGFMVLAFGFTWKAVISFVAWGLLFSIAYPLMRKHKKIP